MCYREGGTLLESEARVDDDDAKTVTNGSIEFGVLNIQDESLVVDVTVSSLIASIVEQGDDDFSADNYGSVVVKAKLHKDCTALPCSATTIDSIFGDGLTMAYVGTNKSTLQSGDDDEYNEGNGIVFESTNTGRFFFPGLANGSYLLENGSYLLEIEFDLTAAITNNNGVGMLQSVEIDEHVVTVFRTASDGGLCPGYVR